MTTVSFTVIMLLTVNITELLNQGKGVNIMENIKCTILKNKILRFRIKRAEYLGFYIDEFIRNLDLPFYCKEQ